MYPEDISEVLKIERLSFTTSWSEASFYNELYSINSIIRIAEFNGIVIGYICVKHIVDECHILNLAVHPDHRRHGIAAILLNDAIVKLRLHGCRFFYLEVRTSNYAARKMYERFGFNMAGIRKSYYANPVEDAVVMMMEL